LALRTQQIIAHESGIPDVVDPLAGSDYVEKLTDELENAAMDLIEKIDELGGAVSAIEQKFQQTEIASSAFDYQKAIDEGEKILVGVNKFATDEHEVSDIQEIDKMAVRKQLDRLNEMKENRNKDEVQKSLADLEKTAAGNENLMPIIIRAVIAHATLGEISDTLRSVFGEY